MAAPDRGLQAVPRGLDRNLTTYLQAIRTELLRLSGLVRGSDQSRAVRASEASVAFGGGTVSTASGSVDMGAIASQIFRDGSVTERKLADRAVAGGKLADNAVTSRTIAPRRGGQQCAGGTGRDRRETGRRRGDRRGAGDADASPRGQAGRGRGGYPKPPGRGRDLGQARKRGCDGGSARGLGRDVLQDFPRRGRDGKHPGRKRHGEEAGGRRAPAHVGFRGREGRGKRRHSGEVGRSARRVSDGMELRRSRAGPRNRITGVYASGRSVSPEVLWTPTARGRGCGALPPQGIFHGWRWAGQERRPRHEPCRACVFQGQRG